MKISELLASAGKPTFSLEMLPVAGLSAAENLYRYKNILARNPIFGDFPEHPLRNSLSFSGQKHSVSQIPDSEELCKELLKTYSISPMMHVLCRGFTPEQIEKKLLHLQDFGIENLLLLRGDILKNTDFPGHKFAYQLVEQVRDFNKGILLTGNKTESNLTFDIGVGGYPEPTSENPDLELTIQYLKQKVDAGADLIITQVFFDNQRFFAFEKACRSAGIKVPIIPGICPFTSMSLLKKLPTFFQVSLPGILKLEIEKCSNPKMLAELGVAWALNQTKELLENGVESIHFFALAEPVYIEKVVEEFF